jgi:hypothetical membrane protein
MRRNTLTRILAVCGIIAPILIVTIIFIAAANTPGYSHIQDTISKLSEQGSSNPELMTIGFITYGVLVIGFSYALYIHLRHGLKAYLTWASFMIYGLCMILAGFYQDIPGGEGVPLNPEGVAHNAIIIASCISFLIGMWAFAGSVYNRHSWAGFTWFTLIASFVGLVLSIVFAVQSYIPASGLWQRLFYFLMVAWIEIVSIWLFRLSFKEE